jgi:multiple sugar transport system substrate-binding protein
VAPSPKTREDLGASTTDIFNSGRAAMLVQGRWGAFFIASAQDHVPWRAVTYPKMKPDGKTTYTFVALGIPESAKDPDAAWEFIKFVIGPEGQRINASTGLGMPVRPDVTEEGSWLVAGESEDSIEVFSQGMEQSKSLPFNPRWTEVIDDIAEKTLDPVWRGEMTAAEATKILCDKIDPILANP